MKKSTVTTSSAASNTGALTNPISIWKKIGHWLDDNALLYMAGFLIAFIPLYPKLPLADIIPGYLVRLRLEDVFVGATFLLWFIQILRKKVTIHSPLFIPIALYALAGFLSSISAVLITQTVPAELLHYGKTFLHYFRYLEYFSLYLIVASAIKTKKQVGVLVGIIVATVLAITVYGYGQKYWYWPVYSTMNREFAKGIRLVLTEHARVQSTFGGHYDLGGYLVIMLPILLAMRYVVTKKWMKIVLTISFIGGLWLLIMTAARTSFFAYLVAASGLIAFHGFTSPGGWLKRVVTTTATLLVFGTLNLVLLLAFGDNMYARLVQVVDSYPSVAQPYHAVEQVTIEKYHQINGQRKVLLANLTKNPDEWFTVKRPDNAVDFDQVVVTPSPVISADTQPSPARPSDVTGDIPDYVQVATASADGTITYTTEEKPRIYSDSALKYGLSLGIRLDTLWPRALQGYYSNPLLGSGYATLTKDSIGQFTEAESTDNNFLRTLGETGALGFVSFYGVVILASYLAIKLVRTKSIDALSKWFAVGYLAATLGLLINALYIDIFAASKVAFSFWALTGIVVALYILTNEEGKKKSSHA